MSGGFVGVDSWNLWFGWLKEYLGNVNGCEISCTVTVDLPLGSQAGSYLTRYRFDVADLSRATNVTYLRKALISGLSVNIAKNCQGKRNTTAS